MLQLGLIGLEELFEILYHDHIIQGLYRCLILLFCQGKNCNLKILSTPFYHLAILLMRNKILMELPCYQVILIIFVLKKPAGTNQYMLIN